MAMYCSEYQYSKFFNANCKKTALIDNTSANSRLQLPLMQ